MKSLVHTSLSAINTAALWIAAACIFGMTMLGGLDVLSTAFLGEPIHTVVEATEAMMVMIVFLGLGMVHQNRLHIAADLLPGLLPPLGRRILHYVALVLMLAFFAMLAWRGWLSAQRSWRIGEYAAGLVAFPIYPARIALAAGATLAALNCLSELIFGPLPTEIEEDRIVETP